MLVYIYCSHSPRMQDLECAGPGEGVDATHAYMPMFQVKRLLPNYKLQAEQERAKRDCNKFTSACKKLTAGLFLIYCAHGVCVGFKLMPRNEGPSTLHELLYTRLDKGMCTGCQPVENGSSLILHICIIFASYLQALAS